MQQYELEFRKTLIRINNGFGEHLKHTNILLAYLSQGNADYNGAYDDHYIERHSDFYYYNDEATAKAEFEYYKLYKTLKNNSLMCIYETILRAIQKDPHGNITKSLIKYYCSEVDDHDSEKEAQTGGTK